MDAKHTPGPWMWATSNSWLRLMRVGGRDGGVLCPTVSRSDGHPDLAVSDADQALIAAAPDLLAACRDAQAVLAMIVRAKPGDGSSVLTAYTLGLKAEAACRAALAAATGEGSEAGR